jgi:hypothetical protein
MSTMPQTNLPEEGGPPQNELLTSSFVVANLEKTRLESRRMIKVNRGSHEMPMRNFETNNSSMNDENSAFASLGPPHNNTSMKQSQAGFEPRLNKDL